MEIIKVYIIALIAFCVIDGIWLGFVAKDLYAKEMGSLLAKDVNWYAAVAFYLLFLVGLVYFVINPGLDQSSIKQVIMAGALFGLITYATYDLTALAVVKGWPLKLTFIDLAWGTFLSTSVSTITYYVVQLMK